MVITVLVAGEHGLLRQGICSLLERQEDIRILGVAVNGQEAVNETRKELHGELPVARDLRGFRPRRRGVATPSH